MKNIVVCCALAGALFSADAATKAFGPTVRDMRENGTFHVLQEVPH